MEPSPPSPFYVNITAMTVVKIILVLILFYFLYLIRDILAVLFVSLVFASAIDPWVDWLQKRRVPRGVGVFLIYLGLIGSAAGVVYLLIPPIVAQVGDLADKFPALIDRLLNSAEQLRVYASQHGWLDSVKQAIDGVTGSIQGAAGSVFSTVTGFFGGIFTFFLVLVITFYMVVEENALKKLVWSIAPERHQIYIMQLLNRMQHKVGLWLRGQLILSLIIFAMTWLALSIVDWSTGLMPYALVLALLAGLTEFVPYLGPILAAIPAVFLALTISPMLALTVGVIYYVIQLLENNIIVPKLMEKVVGINPIVSIAVLMIGFKLAGIVGAILSIPVATAITVFIRDLFDKNTQDREAFEE